MPFGYHCAMINSAARKFINAFIALIFIAATTFAAGQYKPGDKVNVWLIDGVKLYASPKALAKVITTIPYGQQVNIITEAGASDKKTMLLETMATPKPYALNGYWVKVSSAGKTGYVFDGYLSKMPCFKINTNSTEELSAYMQRNFGLLKTTKRTGKKGDKTTSRSFNNGNALVEEQYDGCFTDNITLKNISYREALLFVKAYSYKADALSEVKVNTKGKDAVMINTSACD